MSVKFRFEIPKQLLINLYSLYQYQQACQIFFCLLWHYILVHHNDDTVPLITRGVPNSGFRLFGRIRIRIRIALPVEHFDTAPAVLIFTTYLNLCRCLYDRCLLSMLSSRDPLPFIRLS